jgi:hypothetical protein
VAGTQLTVTMSRLDPTTTTPASAFVICNVVQPGDRHLHLRLDRTLDLASPPNNSEVVAIRYSQPSSSGDRMRDTAVPTENETANFGTNAVVNNTPDTIAPSISSASVNASTISLLFNEALAGAAPDPTAFTVTTRRRRPWSPRSR